MATTDGAYDGAGHQWLDKSYIHGRQHPTGPGHSMLAVGGDSPFKQHVYVSSMAAKTPTIVLIHGMGCTSLDFHKVARLLDHSPFGARYFSYDRVLWSSSDAFTQPRSCHVLAAELLALLTAVIEQCPPPYVLVGHSYGGLIAQSFAMTRPDLVAGLVSVDGAHEDQFEVLPADHRLSMAKILPRLFALYGATATLEGPHLLDALGLFNFPPTYLYEDGPRAAAIEAYSCRRAWSLARAEVEGCPVGVNEVRRDRATNACAAPDPSGLPDIPMIFIIASDRKHTPSLHPQGYTDGFNKLHRSLFLCKTNEKTVQRGTFGVEFVEAKRSDHWVMLQEPELVVQCIEHVVSDWVEHGTKPGRTHLDVTNSLANGVLA